MAWTAVLHATHIPRIASSSLHGATGGPETEQPVHSQIVAQQGGKRGASTVREEHNAMMRSLLAIKVADLREPEAQRV